jgi:hypothetical protein
MFSRSRSWGLVSMLVMLVACGCGPGVVNNELPAPKQNLFYIVAAYQQAQIERGGKGPKNWEQLTPYLAARGDVEKLKVSPRDNQEYQVVWGINSNAVSSVPIVAYETTGVDGVHLAANIRPSIRELSDAEVEKLNKGTQPTMLKR